MKVAKFEVWKTPAGEWRWHLKAANGEIVAASEGYKTRAGAMTGIRALRTAVDAALLAVLE